MQIGNVGAHVIAEALRKNKVMLLLPSTASKMSICFLFYLQTLTKLNLSSNTIDQYGAHDLADALQNNKVLTIVFHPLYSYPSLHAQTLKMLDLTNCSNNCVAIGAAMQLRNDPVISLFSTIF